jgi:hypothetical protein
VQDTLIRAYQAAHRFDGRHPRAWLLTIMRRAEANRHRRRRPHLLDEPGTETEPLAAGLAPSARATCSLRSARTCWRPPQALTGWSGWIGPDRCWPIRPRPARGMLAPSTTPGSGVAWDEHAVSRWQWG